MVGRKRKPTMPMTWTNLTALAKAENALLALNLCYGNAQHDAKAALKADVRTMRLAMFGTTVPTWVAK